MHLHAVCHVREQCRDVLADRHGGDDLLDGLPLLLLLVRVELRLELEDLALLGRGEVLGVRHLGAESGSGLSTTGCSRPRRSAALARR